MQWPLLCVSWLHFFSSPILSVSFRLLFVCTMNTELLCVVCNTLCFFVVASLATQNKYTHRSSYCYVESHSHLRLNIHANFIAFCTPPFLLPLCFQWLARRHNTEHRSIYHDKFVHRNFPKEHFRRLIAIC